MSDEPKKLPEEDKAPLSTGKRNALLRYMAILFGVAFLLVLLSFLIQMRNSQDTISDLHKSNASALENAGVLQAENERLTTVNRELNDENEALAAQIEQLESDARTADEAAAEAMAQLADLETQMEAERAEANAEFDATRAAYDLLVTAQTAFAAQDRTALTNALNALSSQVALLSPAAQSQYDQLVKSLTAEEIPPETENNEE